MESTSILGLLVALMALAVIVGLMLLFPSRWQKGAQRGDEAGAAGDEPAGTPVSAASWPGFYYAPAPGELEEAREVAQIYPGELPPEKPSDVDTVVSSDDPEKLRQSLINILSIGMQVVDRYGRPLTTDEIDRFISERAKRGQPRQGYALKEEGEEKEAAVAAVPSQPAEEPEGRKEERGRYAQNLSRLSALRANMAESSGKN